MPPNGVISTFAMTLNSASRHRVTVDSGRPSVTGLREQPQALARILKWNKLIISLRL
ncbi:hypothetical protein ATN83_2545 [Raoultella ornithinolytica]|jgi:hypothetical protein|nr:hypothetical protein ATN83_2545 [Raoultella ornithinolytica]